MIMHKDSNKLYPSMVAGHQIILECSIIMHKIIHSLEIDTSWLLNLLKLLIFLKWLKQNLTICKRLYKSRKKCSYFYCLPNKHKIFHLLGLCWQRFMESLCTTATVIAFTVRDVMALKGIFSIFLLAGLVKLMVLFTDL